MPTISVIIISYNSGAERLERALASLAIQTYRDFEIILFDNDSKDSCIDDIAAQENLKIIRHSENLGFAEGVNAAVKHAQGDWFAMLNPDATAAPEWLDKLFTATKRFPDAASFGSVQLKAEDHEVLDGLGDVYHFTGIAWRGGFGAPDGLVPTRHMEIFAPCAAGALYRRQVFEQLGGFEEDYFCYHEDVDLGARMRLAGGYSVLVHDAVIYHEGSGTTGRHSSFTVYHGVRNRIRTFIRNTPAPLFWLLFPIHFMMNLLLLIKSSFHGAMAPHLKGMRDGFLHSKCAWHARERLNTISKKQKKAYLSSLTWSFGLMVQRGADLRSLPED